MKKGIGRMMRDRPKRPRVPKAHPPGETPAKGTANSFAKEHDERLRQAAKLRDTCSRSLVLQAQAPGSLSHKPRKRGSSGSGDHQTTSGLGIRRNFLCSSFFVISGFREMKSPRKRREV